MLVTKRFYLLFALVLIALHPIMMFAMARAPEMGNIADYGDYGSNELDRIAQEFEVDDNEIHQPASAPKFQNYLDEFSNVLQNQPTSVASSSHLMPEEHTEEQLAALAQEIQDLRRQTAQVKQITISYGRYRFRDFSERGEQVLETFLEKLTPPKSFRINKKGIHDILPLFAYNDRIYFLSKMDAYPFFVYSRPFNRYIPVLYGRLKPGLTPETIKEWGMQNGFWGKSMT